MNNFPSPSLKNYRNSEFLQFMKDALKLLDSYDVFALELMNEQNHFETAIQALASVFETEQERPLTNELTLLDNQRDQLYVGIRHLLRGNKYHFDATKQAAAKRLHTHFQSYGKDVHRMAYQSQTALISNMMQEWHTEKDLQAAVASLQLSEWASRLQTVNTEFGKLFVARISEITANDAPTFTSLRIHAKTTYRMLVARILAFKTLDVHEDYAKLYAEIHELAREYNLVLKVRAKR
ncbi:hypothetical protein KORDIASMS9_03199 [Kordia sp. SMS9]|uniref:DUF6261 family protein n=1 Tax=Kordia sp. SMS9 TaxID=2282170 RepID=UPI000E0D149E|nr:DUF6261 family protein [Kordia sp. SMS9]AXG70944.1 hypothetical protein KORDIASMS9_03199 [Kordia sp. SMS9]